MAEDDKTDTGATPTPGKRAAGAKPKASGGTTRKAASASKPAATRKPAVKGPVEKPSGSGTTAKSAEPVKGPTKPEAKAAKTPSSPADRLSEATDAIDRAASDAANWAKETGGKAGNTLNQASERTTKAAERASEALSEAAAAVSDAAESFAGVSDAASGPKAGKPQSRLAHIAYLLFALSPILAVSSIAGIMLAYMRRNVDGVAGTLLESHYNWLIWTFWYGLAAYVVSGILVLIFVGYFLLALTSVWMIWRLTKGWLYLYDGKAISNPTAAL